MNMVSTGWMMDPEVEAEGRMRWYASDWGMMFDTCALMHRAAPLLMEHLAPMLRQYGTKVMVPWAVITELIRLSDDGRSAERAESAQQGLELLAGLMRQGLLMKIGDEREDFGDNAILASLQRLCAGRRMLLVTRDWNLASDAMAMNEYHLERMHPVEVRQINRYGYFSPVQLRRVRPAGIPARPGMSQGENPAALLQRMPVSSWSAAM